MKRHLAFALAGLMLVSPSCVSGPGLEGMDEAQFARLVQNVESVSTIGFVVLKPQLSPKAQEVLVKLGVEVKAALEGGSVPLPTSLNMIVDYFASQLAEAGVSAQEVALIKASMMLIDNSLGGVRLGVDGIGSERTEAVVLSIVKGLELGLK